MVPTIQCYEDAGDFTVTERLKTSIRENLIFYLSVGSIGLFGLILLIIMHRDWYPLYTPLPFLCPLPVILSHSLLIHLSSIYLSPLLKISSYISSYPSLSISLSLSLRHLFLLESTI